MSFPKTIMKTDSSWECSRFEQLSSVQLILYCTTKKITFLFQYFFPDLLWYQAVQSLSHVQIFQTPWTVACQASLSIPNSQSLLRLMCIRLVMSSNHLILCPSFSSCLQSFPALGSFLMNQFFASGDQRIGASALASVLPMNIQDWFPLGLTGWIS